MIVESSDTSDPYVGTMPNNQKLWLCIKKEFFHKTINELPIIIFEDVDENDEYINNFGFIKTAIMLLGIKHHHNSNGDMLITAGWESLLEGLKFLGFINIWFPNKLCQAH